MKNKVIKIITTLFVIMLTADLGRVSFNGHDETYYSLPMHNIVTKAQDNGIVADYWERADGCKMYGRFIICAGHQSRYGEIVETSRGTGIILDTGDFAKDHPEDIDMATTWKE